MVTCDRVMSLFTDGGCPMREPLADQQPRATVGAGTSGTQWQTSSYSNSQGSCVEVARGPDAEVWFRDSKNHSGPVIRVASAAAAKFLQALTDPHTPGRRPASRDRLPCLACTDIIAEAAHAAGLLCTPCRTHPGAASPPH
ncbi:DUF397 domain-containing protein [Streptomyces sp. NPDC059215]|uniref:DUF397 domain-containing protein n=1 Tax=Streptomyces sp. NPDC059215 TaxID=3346772 RepID=UPI003683EC7B